MQDNISDMLLTLIDCVDRITNSEQLSQQQQNDLITIKSIGESLGNCFDNLDKEIGNLKQRIRQLNQSQLNVAEQNEDKIYVLLALMFARLKQAINVNDLLETVVIETYQLLQKDHVIVYQFTEQDSQPIEYEAVCAPHRSLLGQLLPSIYTDRQWLDNYRTCISQVIHDLNAPDVDSKITDSLIPLGVHSSIAVAIPSDKKLWGLLIIHQYDDMQAWQPWEIELLENLGTQLAIAIHQMQLLMKSDDIRIERDKIIAKLHHSQLHDSLTGLPNRDSFMKSLDLAFAKLKSESSHNFGVLFIDCDRFKLINDNFGISIGDQLLKDISKRLSVHQKINTTIARIDSDEFAILVESNDQDYPELESLITELANQIIEDIKQEFLIEEYQIFTSVSIGIAISDLEYICANEILRDAHIAMHYSRSFGRGKQAVFKTDMNQGARARWQLENDLRQAIAKQEFHLVYQPIVSLHQHRLTGFEVLLRWMHPLQGLISPQEFLPILEETEEIIDVGYWVLVSACKQLRKWQQDFPKIPPLTLSINVSTVQVMQLDFVERIQSIIEEQQILPSSIKLELTETILMNNITVSSQKLEQLRELGVQVYIDDFGTGYSSFSYLQRLPIDVLKIDRSFTSKVSTDIKSQRIIQSILRLANTLGMGIVIEGVETAQELGYFEELGGSCIDIQGFFISHPLDSHKATQWIESTT
ncbi:putative bifunctional diguanylate cyclase/phosphodiesterase [Pseudanabaena mucicola]|uniref:Bifunctional diguanylate cyclase/phosphodiesterase n=1 Tax=Pseudanabaena mucicola FACHB-723 TaxID=2692860 RepID=A0ABR7ZSB4_9CYAN|nr:bifunctional diguanylate cyclase/phosphodiesterase [Pseudanabaena mucicola]MBD2186836.1 bifunctional diguanylate cyclase/phosphodiesterase [Pseudanabaena mucicola FACHB-723]